MKSPLWFVLAGIIFIAGAVAGGFRLVSIFTSEDLVNVVELPGSVTLTLKEGGTYTIFHEVRVVHGRAAASTSRNDLALSMSGPDGEVRLVPSVGGSSRRIEDRAITELFTFTVTTPGDYRLSGTRIDGRMDPKLTLVIEADGAAEGLMLGTMGLIFGCVAISGIIVMLTLWRRRVAKQRA